MKSFPSERACLKDWVSHETFTSSKVYVLSELLVSQRAVKLHHENIKCAYCWSCVSCCAAYLLLLLVGIWFSDHSSVNFCLGSSCYTSVMITPHCLAFLDQPNKHSSPKQTHWPTVEFFHLSAPANNHIFLSSSCFRSPLLCFFLPPSYFLTVSSSVPLLCVVNFPPASF